MAPSQQQQSVQPCPTCMGKKTIAVSIKKHGTSEKVTEQRPCPSCNGLGVGNGTRYK